MQLNMKRITHFKKIWALAAGCGLAAFQASAQVIPIDNLGSTGAVYNTLFSPSTFGQNSGWTVTSGSIDQIGTYWQSPDGYNSVDMDGDNPGSIQTIIDVPTAGAVTIDFALSGNPDGGIPLKTLSVDLGSAAAQTFTYTTGANDHGNMMYASESAVFIVPAGNLILSFSSLDASSSPFGPVVGAISGSEVSSVPDGGFSMALLGMSSMALGWLRRKMN